MAYIKKLKSNELIGGTDNTDVYPVTSTQAIYNPDNVSQEYLNNHITTDRIVDKAITGAKLADSSVYTRCLVDQSITEYKLSNSSICTRVVQNKAITEPKLADNAVSTDKIADGAVSMDKLDGDVLTLIQQAVSNAWIPKGTWSATERYDVNDLIYYEPTNSSYISTRADNVGHIPAYSSAVGGWWMKVIDGSYGITLAARIEALETVQKTIAAALNDLNNRIS